MKKIYLSLAVVGLLAAQNMMADTLEKAFKSGTIEGELGVYGQSQDPKASDKNGFSGGHIMLNYETQSFYNFSVGLGAWANTIFDDKASGDYDGNTIANKAIFRQAFIKYEDGELLKVVAGRQEVDFQWMTDFIEGARVDIGYIDNVTMTLLWAKRQAVVDVDEVGNFEDMNAHKGVFMADVKYTPFSWLEFNPFYYHAEDKFKAPGMKTTLTFEPMDELKTTTALTYTKGNSEIEGTPDGAVTQFEQGFEFLGAKLALGYIKVDKDGTADLNAYGDQMPFEEAQNTLSPDARTPYISVSYEIDKLKLETIYGRTKYYDADADAKLVEKEFNIKATYEVLKDLEASLMYVNVKNDDDSQSYNAIKAGVNYKF